jgi:signal transduction histidine kinase
MKFSRLGWGILGAWATVVGGYGLILALEPPGFARTTAADLLECLIPLFANACLLWNAASPYKRRNFFWMLLALGCGLWLMGQLWWTYDELVLRQDAPRPFAGDVIFFLHTVPLMAALALQPHARKLRETLLYSHVDIVILTCCWLYLYVFVVIPWKTAWPNAAIYHERYFQLYDLENLLVLVALALPWLRSNRPWRIVYAHLFGAASLYVLSLLFLERESSLGTYHTGGLADLPLLASFMWFATAGLIAHQLEPAPDPTRQPILHMAHWPGSLSMAGLFTMPLLAAWSATLSQAPEPVRRFRLLLTLGAIISGGALLFLRQYLVNQDRQQLLGGLRGSLERLQRLQTQFVQAEKLASLGQLAAGAAHEINNPLTAILGYAELISDDKSAGELSHSLAEKIREQARRTKTLVTNLLSFARQVPAEKQLLDLNNVISSALQLRKLDLREKHIRIELKSHSVLPAVRGDPNQLLQVFYHLIRNAVEAMEEVGGGVLTVSTHREKANVVIEFSDTGPGIRDVDRVFDPFYTTKPVGKGTGLGLSICYGIIQEHGGQITGYNRPGGSTFRIELPAVLALLPRTASPSATPVATP